MLARTVNQGSIEFQEQTRCFTIFNFRNFAVKKHPYFLALLLLGLLLSSACSRFGRDNLPELTAEQTDWIGERIFANECNLKIPCLTSWNAGEDFPSLGIGHFIWYRNGQQEVFVESFPALLAFYEEKEIKIPEWIAALPERHSPWPDRVAFLSDLESPRMQTLRDFLNDTRGVQVEFIIQRMHASLPSLLAHTQQPEALNWLRLAAMWGDESSQGFLGDRYASGKGVAKDEVEAFAFYRLASVYPSSPALKNLSAGKKLTAMESKMSADARERSVRRADTLKSEIAARLKARETERDARNATKLSGR